MACSDNTIRAGLTPKFKDIPTLCQSLTYGMGRPPLVLPVAVEADKGTFAYRPIFKDPEFAIHKITVFFLLILE
jgi:mannose-6-phosphate isomerase